MKKSIVNAIIMKDLFRKIFSLIIFLAILISSCRKDERLFSDSKSPFPADDNTPALKNDPNSLLKSDSYVAQAWYSLMLRLVKETPGHTPPIAARSFGYVGVTLYESVLGERPRHHSLAGQLQELVSIPGRKYGNAYAVPLIVNAALARIIRKLFRNASVENMNRIDSLQLSIISIYSKSVSEEILTRSIEYGHAVADAVFEWSLSDGGDQAYLNNFPFAYVPPIGPGKWMPTPPLHQNAMLPYWGKNRPMLVTDNPGSIDPPIPPLFSNLTGSSFYKAAVEVYTTQQHLNVDQQTIALYWADGGGSFTPPGHNIAIALQLIRNRHLDLYPAAILLAKLGIAENDAGIVCWRAKYVASLLRPVTYIQSYIDPAWMPLIATPPFPSYTSGHSTFSSAAATILTDELGNNISFSDSSKIADGFSPRTFSNFKMAALEAAQSRLYAGIHYRFDNENGFICGQLIAANVERLNW